MLKQESGNVFNRKSQFSAAAFAQLAQLIIGFVEQFFRCTYVANVLAGAALESASYTKCINEEDDNDNEYYEEGDDL
ncbi:MAG: hypothetical protein EZS28_052662, partial [Streblomastix strix]